MHLNLARKWRSKYFDEVVGQQLAVRLVKNSLYRNLIFPVYLLSGTRGCGKTSVARIFAAALNCAALEQFQKTPQDQQIPCLACQSCKAMQAMNHPDFIEIDAASHTGVDNVRAIIDAASFVPVLGKKKIYLIDEAHMLSKAAFNAFLKILEEPPTSVVFMLATTDPHKIIDTVISRCFHLFFEPIKVPEVVGHLSSICTQEQLEFEKDALTLIAQETEGSMRDALNLIERIRIAYPAITLTAVTELLGRIDDDRLCDLLGVVLEGGPQEVLAALDRLGLEAYNPQVVWKRFVELIRSALWLKNGIAPDEEVLAQKLKSITANCSIERLIQLFEICYDYELLFAKTAAPGRMLEMMLLKMTQKSSHAEASGKLLSAPALPKVAPKIESRIAPVPRVMQPQSLEKQELVPEVQAENLKSEDLVHGKSQSVTRPDKQNSQNETTAQASMSEERRVSIGRIPTRASEQVSAEGVTANAPCVDIRWTNCLAQIEKLNDPLIVSVFKQGVFSAYNEQSNSLEIVFSQDLLFFKEWLENSKKLWKPLLERFFGEGTVLMPLFTGAPKERPNGRGATVSAGSAMQSPEPASTVQTNGAIGRSQNTPQGKSAYASPYPSRNGTGNRSSKVEPERVVTVTDPEKWQNATALLSVFEGTLTVSQEQITPAQPVQASPVTAQQSFEETSFDQQLLDQQLLENFDGDNV